MTRFQRRLDSDTGYQDARIVAAVNDIGVVSGQGTVVLNLTGAAGTAPILHLTTNTATSFIISLTKIIFRTGLQDDLQEQFGSGSATGAQGLASSSNPTPAGVSGSPPYTGVSQFTPVTAPRPKGFQLTGFIFRYIVNTANLTANTWRVNKFSYVDNAAVVTTAIQANTNMGAPNNTFRANPHVVQVALAANAQTFNITPASDVVLEWDIANNGGSTDILGVDILGTYNLH